MKLAVLEYFATLNNIIATLNKHNRIKLSKFFTDMLEDLKQYFIRMLEFLNARLSVSTITRIIEMINIFSIEGNSTGYRRSLFSVDSIDEIAMSQKQVYDLSAYFNLLYYYIFLFYNTNTVIYDTVDEHKKKYKLKI